MGRGAVCGHLCRCPCLCLPSRTRCCAASPFISLRAAHSRPPSKGATASTRSRMTSPNRTPTGCGHRPGKTSTGRNLSGKSLLMLPRRPGAEPCVLSGFCTTTSLASPAASALRAPGTRPADQRLGAQAATGCVYPRIEHTQWGRGNELPCGSGCRSSCRDAARVGQLWANKGYWPGFGRDNRLMPESYANKAQSWV